MLESGNRISTSLTSAFNLLTPNSIGNMFFPLVVYMCDMVTLGRKGNVLDPGNCIFTSMYSAFYFLPLNSIKHLPPVGSLYV
jgi:hypothetical protein